MNQNKILKRLEKIELMVAVLMREATDLSNEATALREELTGVVSTSLSISKKNKYGASLAKCIAKRNKTIEEGRRRMAGTK